MNLQKILLSILICTVLFISGCKSSPLGEVSKKELLIYCGTTMAPVVRKIADIFEQREDCVVKMIKDGSGSLYHSIQINQVGDLFLPGSESYMEKCQAEGIVIKSDLVGFNRAVLLVAKGNPLNISADLNNFYTSKYRTVLGASGSGSIGRETRLILATEGNYRKAVEQAILLASDSKNLVRMIENKRADLTINWYAAAIGDDEALVDILRLDDAIAPPHELMLGLLKTSHHPKLARKFMILASSDEGQSLLSRYGFGE